MTVTLERVATLQAEMDAGHSASEVLFKAGLSQGDYLTAKETHLRAIADEVRGGRQVLLRRYQAAFVEHQLALQPKPATAVQPSSHTVPGPAVDRPPQTSSAPFVPSYLRKKSPSSPMVAAQPNFPAPPLAEPAPAKARVMKMTMMADSGPRGPATPFQPRSVTPQPHSRPSEIASTDAPPNSVQPSSVANSQKHTIVADGASAAKLIASVPFKPQQRSFTPAPQSAAPVSARVESGTVVADLSAPSINPLTTEEIRRHASAQAAIKLGREPKDAILVQLGFTAQSFAEAEARWSTQFISDGAARSFWMSIYSARLSSG